MSFDIIDSAIFTRRLSLKNKKCFLGSGSGKRIIDRRQYHINKDYSEACPKETLKYPFLNPSISCRNLYF